MIHRGYGKQFLDSLPSCKVVEDLNQVKEFFKLGTKAPVKN
jgi:hypothetical protein